MAHHGSPAQAPRCSGISQLHKAFAPSSATGWATAIRLMNISSSSQVSLRFARTVAW